MVINVKDVTKISNDILVTNLCCNDNADKIFVCKKIQPYHRRSHGPTLDLVDQLDPAEKRL